MITLLAAILGVAILSLIVFGGGQVFMPLFSSFWSILNNMGANIDADTTNRIFAVANSTPGVISTKFSLFTGYLIANGEWWGFLAMFLTYFVFAIPPLLMIWISYKTLAKTQNSKYLTGIIKYFKPVIAGIIGALIIQLFIGVAFPEVIFNGYNNYIGSKDSVFSGWRKIVLIVYVIVVSLESFYFSYYKKVSIFYLILIHIAIGMVIFEPWLM